MIIWHGLQSYQQGEQIQQEARSLTLRIQKPVLLGFEFQPVISLGLRGRPEKDLLLAPEELKTRGFELHRSSRGGQATLHSPGQLVIYPLIHLPSFGLTVRCWAQHLLNYSQEFLQSQFALKTFQQEGRPGLFTEQGKILYLGLKVSRGLSTHGLALNVNNGLEDFELIRPCGQEHQPQDSLARHGVAASPKEIFDLWAQDFAGSLTSLGCRV